MSAGSSPPSLPLPCGDVHTASSTLSRLPRAAHGEAPLTASAPLAALVSSVDFGRLGPMVGYLMCALWLIGCGSSAPLKPTASPTSTDASGLASRPQAGRPGRAPARRPGSLDPAAARAAAARAEAAAARAGGVPPLSADTLLRMAVYADSLKNAALRDRAMERTMRTYMFVTREVFRRLRTAGSGKTGATSYNPVPAWRFQAQVSRDMRALADRSGLLERHLGKLATADKVREATGPLTPASRPVRIALFRRIFTCIREDTWLRAHHGRAWSSGPANREFNAVARARLYRQELQMMRKSVRCSTLIARRRATN